MMAEFWYMVSADGEKAFIIQAHSRDEAYHRLRMATGQDGSETEMQLIDVMKDLAPDGALEIGRLW